MQQAARAVAGREDARHVRRHRVVGFDVRAVQKNAELPRERRAARRADGEEHAVDGELVFRAPIRKLHTRHALVADDGRNLSRVHDHVRRERGLRRFAVRQDVHLARVRRERLGLVQCVRARTDDGDTLLTVEERVADGAIAHAFALVFFESRHGERLARGAGREDEARRFEREIRALDFVSIERVVESDLQHLARDELHA